MFTDIGRINALAVTENYSQADTECIAKKLGSFHNNTQLAIAKIHHGNLSFYGALKSNGRIISVENSGAVFEIGSITKVFTSTLLVMMANQGLLSIDDSIDKYLDYPLNNNTKITFKAFANHTAGLPRLPPGMLWRAIFTKNDNPYKNYTDDKLIDYLKYQLKQKTKMRYCYSNLGAGILGYVLTKIANQSYENLLQEYIFKPLGMSVSSTQRDQVKQYLTKKEKLLTIGIWHRLPGRVRYFQPCMI